MSERESERGRVRGRERAREGAGARARVLLLLLARGAQADVAQDVGAGVQLYFYLGARAYWGAMGARGRVGCV